MNDNEIIYTAYFVDDTEALREQFPSQLPNKYYDHCTLRFRPSIEDAGLEHTGERRKLHITGRLITDKVDVLAVDPRCLDHSQCQTGRYMPHITLATAVGVPPVRAGKELYELIYGNPPEWKKWQDLDIYVEATRGVFLADKGKATNHKEL